MVTYLRTFLPFWQGHRNLKILARALPGGGCRANLPFVTESGRSDAVPRRPTYTEDEILQARDSLIGPAGSVEPWDVFVALGQKGKFSRVREILEANPPEVPETGVAGGALAVTQLPDEVRERVGQVAAEFSSRALDVINDAIAAEKRAAEAHEAALRETHQRQLQAAAAEVRRLQERSSQLEAMICELEVANEELETRCTAAEAHVEEVRAEAEKLRCDVATVCAERDAIATEATALTEARDAARTEAEGVRGERDRLAAENARLSCELDRLSPPTDAVPQRKAQNGGKAGATSAKGKAATARRAKGSSPKRETVAAPDPEDEAAKVDPWTHPEEPPFPGFVDHDEAQRDGPG